MSLYGLPKQAVLVSKIPVKTRVWRWVKRGVVVIIILGALPFTPLFANLGVGALSLFSAITLPNPDSTPYPQNIIILGGGLTRNADKQIILNHYSQSRADQTVALYDQYPLPIITSGAESPWLREYLLTKIPDAFMLSDNASMNTCENAVFTAKLLSYHELPPSAYLVTDRYHMARARRQFAKAGITTIPAVAPMIIKAGWLSPKNNLVHSRRTVYELIALARDIFRPQSNCRDSSVISLEEISTPRRKAKIFSHL